MKNFWKGKKVLVTGGAGFIGSHIVDTLVQNGAAVTVIVSPKTNQHSINKSLKQVLNVIKILRADLTSLEETLLALKDQEVVLNFAAMDGGKSFKVAYPAQIYKTNTQIVQNVLEASRRNKIERLLIISSIEVYPDMTSSPIKESYAMVEDFSKNSDGYIWSKRFSEVAAKMYSQEYGMKIAVARLGNIYGPRDSLDKEKGRVIPSFINQALKGENITIWGDGKVKRSFLYIDDLAKAVLALTERYAVCDPVNIAGSKVVSIKELAAIIIKEINSNSKIKFIKKNNILSKDKVISIEKAKKVIDFKESMNLVKGIRETINYFNAS